MRGVCNNGHIGRPDCLEFLVIYIIYIIGKHMTETLQAVSGALLPPPGAWDSFGRTTNDGETPCNR